MINELKRGSSTLLVNMGRTLMSHVKTTCTNNLAHWDQIVFTVNMAYIIIIVITVVNYPNFELILTEYGSNVAISLIEQ